GQCAQSRPVPTTAELCKKAQGATPMQSPRRGSSIKAAALALMTAAISLCCARDTWAQSSDSRADQVQQLQVKLSQMEKEMQELKQQISSLQQQASQKPAAPSKAEEALHQAVSEQASAHVPLEEVGNAPLPPESGTTLD